MSQPVPFSQRPFQRRPRPAAPRPAKEAELREFLEAEPRDVEIDASFKDRLREELWALLRAGTRR